MTRLVREIAGGEAIGLVAVRDADLHRDDLPAPSILAAPAGKPVQSVSLSGTERQSSEQLAQTSRQFGRALVRCRGARPAFGVQANVALRL